jgi:hypothetical protein
MVVGTAVPAYFGSTANHVHAVGSFALFGAGTLAVIAVVSLRAPNTIAITGGMGS